MTTGTGGWKSWLGEHFAAYLMPSSAASPMTVEEAEAFLARIAPERKLDLQLVCTASLFSAPEKAQHLGLFLDDVAELVRGLPSVTEPQRREWRGGFRGRLDVGATLAAHLAGQPDLFVTRDRRRHFELPENLLLAAVLRRLLGLVVHLARAGLVASGGWSGPLLTARPRLEHFLWRTRLAELPDVAVTQAMLHAADNARGPAYRQGALWHRWMEDALDRAETRALHVARGALLPLKDEYQFQLAVTLRLVEWARASLEQREPGAWTLERAAILPGRDEIAVLHRGDGARIQIWYDCVPDFLPRGAHHEGASHYFGSAGVMRPDVVMRFVHGSEATATVFEVKFSDDLGYLIGSGLTEAHLYRHEYASALGGWPKAVLIVPKGLSRTPRSEHDVIVLGWEEWWPHTVDVTSCGITLSEVADLRSAPPSEVEYFR